MNGAQLIADERRRQVLSEGWTPEHDDDHTGGELAIVAAELAVHGTDASVDTSWLGDDAWNLVAKHQSDRLRQLVIAGALIAAEIDREQRRAGGARG